MIIDVVIIHGDTLETPCAGGVVGDLTIGTLNLKANLQAIGVRGAFSGDATANATATLQFRQTGSTTWVNAYTPIIDRRTTINGTANPYVNEARGSIVGLTENTPYDVKLTWTDSGQSSCVSSTVTTATSTPPTGGGTFYVDGASGSDATGTGSTGAPWATITKALASTAAGDTIKVRTGTYAAFTITTSGTATAYRKIEPDTAATVTIAGATNTINVQGDYWWIKGLTLGASTSSCVLINGTRHHLYITNCSAANFGTGEVFGTGFIATTAAVHDLFILANTATRTTSTSTAQGVDGISFQGTGNYNVVVDSNSFTGPMWDGIGNGTNSFFDNFENVDFSNNTISNYYDDSIEMDGGAINLRVWGNHTSTTQLADTVSNGADALSEAGTIVGPAYIFRNYLTSAGGSAIKGGHIALGYCFYFHNTIVTSRSGGGYQTLTQAGGSPQSQNHVFRNNIFKATGNNVWYQEGNRSGNSYDYDVLWRTTVGTVIDTWDTTGGGVNASYATFADFLAAGWQATTPQEHNGKYGDPILDVNLHITSTSNAHDAGVVLANFNSADSAWPYSSTAPDIGAYEVPS